MVRDSEAIHIRLTNPLTNSLADGTYTKHATLFRTLFSVKKRLNFNFFSHISEEFLILLLYSTHKYAKIFILILRFTSFQNYRLPLHLMEMTRQILHLTLREAIK